MSEVCFVLFSLAFFKHTKQANRLDQLFTFHISFGHTRFFNSYIMSNSHMKLHDLPIDIVRYHLLPFLNCTSAVKLTQTSQSLFHTLRYKIHRTQPLIYIERFVDQSLSTSNTISVCSSVRITNKGDLSVLVQHCADESVIKVQPLLRLELTMREPMYTEVIELPSSLHTFTFESECNQSISHITLPLDLHTLTFGFCFNRSIYDVKLPAKLHTLQFGGLFDKPVGDVAFPPKLQNLTFGDGFNQTLVGITLPFRLQTLEFGFMFNQPLAGTILPSRLRTLRFGSQFNQSISEVTLPATLQQLIFGLRFNQSIANIAAHPGIKTLIFGRRFTQSLAGMILPTSLETLTFGFDFNQSLDAIVISSSLQTLTFGLRFNQSLVGIQFPPNLVIRKEGGIALHADLLPPGLHIVYCDSSSSQLTT